MYCLDFISRFPLAFLAVGVLGGVGAVAMIAWCLPKVACKFSGRWRSCLIKETTRHGPSPG